MEDKIAGVYDHAAVTRAIEQGHAVVFFAIDGALPSGEGAGKRIAMLAQSVSGIDKGSVRVSVELATLAIAYDPRRANLGQLQNALERKLSALGLSLLAMRVMDRPGDLAAVRRR